MIRLLTAALLVTSFSSAYPDDYNNYDITPLGAAIDGDAAYDFAGWSVSLASNGSRLAVGADGHDGANGENSGRTRVYEWDGSSWSPLGAAIDGDAASDYAGTSVSLASNGSRLAVGAYRHDGANGENSGRTRVYEWDGSSWSPLGAAIDGDAAGDYAGYSVSLTSNGSRLAVGAYLHDGANGVDSGRTRVYEWDGSSWSPLGAAIDGDAAGDATGRSVSLASNGSRLAVGAFLHDGANGVDSGRTQVYEWDGSSWSPLGAAIDGDAAYDYAGTSVSLASNGSRLAVGAPLHDGANGVNSGRTRVYQISLGPGVIWFLTRSKFEGDE